MMKPQAKLDLQAPVGSWLLSASMCWEAREKLSFEVSSGPCPVSLHQTSTDLRPL